jgi:hypothetical protein
MNKNQKSEKSESTNEKLKKPIKKVFFNFILEKKIEEFF